MVPTYGKNNLQFKYRNSEFFLGVLININLDKILQIQKM